MILSLTLRLVLCHVVAAGASPLRTLKLRLKHLRPLMLFLNLAIPKPLNYPT